MKLEDQYNKQKKLVVWVEDYGVGAAILAIVKE